MDLYVDLSKFTRPEIDPKIQGIEQDIVTLNPIIFELERPIKVMGRNPTGPIFYPTN